MNKLILLDLQIVYFSDLFCSSVLPERHVFWCVSVGWLKQKHKKSISFIIVRQLKHSALSSYTGACTSVSPSIIIRSRLNLHNFRSNTSLCLRWSDAAFGHMTRFIVWTLEMFAEILSCSVRTRLWKVLGKRCFRRSGVVFRTRLLASLSQFIDTCICSIEQRINCRMREANFIQQGSSWTIKTDDVICD